MYNLLIVEDEKYTRNRVVKYLTEELNGCFNVVSAEDGKDALELMKKTHFDIVVTDIMMQFVNGIVLAEEIYKNFKDCIVMIMSGYEEFEYAQKAIQFNVRKYFLKPFDLAELCEEIMLCKEELDKKSHNVFNYDGKIYEDRADFFANLIYNRIEDFDEELKKSKTLYFPFDLENTPCEIILLKIEEYESFLTNKWYYGEEAFNLALNNLISGFLKNQYVFCIRAEMGYFEYIIYHSEGKYDYNALTGKISTIANISVKLRKEEEFSDIRMALSRKKENSSESELFFTDLLNTEENINENISESMERAKKYVQHNYGKNILRDDVAKMAMFSSSYFAKNFKDYTGESFSDYLLKTRMENAVRLIREDKHKIAKIAEMVGYQNPKYFYRVFKMYYGCTPKEYATNILKMTYNFGHEEEN